MPRGCMNFPRGLAADFSPTPRHLSHVPDPEAGIEPIRTRQETAPAFWAQGCRNKGSSPQGGSCWQRGSPTDVNECRRPLERRVCHHSCHNTVGSFLCTCRPGFRLRADRVSCEGEPPTPQSRTQARSQCQAPPPCPAPPPSSQAPPHPRPRPHPQGFGPSSFSTHSFPVHLVISNSSRSFSFPPPSSLSIRPPLPSYCFPNPFVFLQMQQGKTNARGARDRSPWNLGSQDTLDKGGVSSRCHDSAVCL